MFVHVEAPRPVNLEIQDRSGSWAIVCAAPCDRDVEPGSYRITGNGIRASRGFALEVGPQRVTIQVDPSTSGVPTGAVVLVVVGSIGLAPGAAVTALIVVGEIAGAIFICPIAAAFETDKSKQSSEYADCLGSIATFFGAAYSQPWVWGPAIGGGILVAGGIVWLAVPPSNTGVHQVTASAGRQLTAQATRWLTPSAAPQMPGVSPVISRPLLEVRF